MGRSRSFVKFFIVLVALLVIAFATRSLWLSALGWALINAEPPSKADIAVVLGGDFYGHRILKAADLVRGGYVPRVLVSGPPGFYGQHECDLAIPYAVRHGYSPEWFIAFPHSALSTDEEARTVVPELRRTGVHTFLLVTSDYHTARARRIFRRYTGGLEMHVVAAPDEFFRPQDWWRNRQAEKTFLLEWAKTISSPLGL